MKIIQIIPQFGFGGAETMCENLSIELKRQGHSITVISLFNLKSAITERIENEGIEVIYLDKKKGLDISIIRKLYSILKKIKPDVVHSHLYVQKYTMWSSIFLNIKKRIHTVHNVADKESGRIDRFINKINYKFFKTIPVALSEEVQETICNTYKVNKKIVPIVFNGSDLTKCIVKENYEIENTFKILHIGRFAKAKNHAMLIRIFEQLKKEIPNAELNLIGQGDLLEDIKKMVNEKKLEKSVKFLGVKNECYSNLVAADLFLFPSIYEGMPMVLIEAMGTGLPIIASKVGGVPDMIKDKHSGILVDLDEQEILKSVIELSNNKEYREKIGKQAVLEAEKYSSKYMAEKYVEIYKEQ